MQNPPGGPPDFAPPVLLSVVPDSGTVAESLADHLVFQFDEVVSEQAGGGIERLVRLSPRTPALGTQVDIDWRRNAIAVRPRGGWRPNLVYHVTLLPGVSDLRNNQLDSGRTIIFTTGGPIPDTEIRGFVMDWENDRVGTAAVVEAMLLPDSLVYVATADTIGAYRLGALPRGTYTVSGSIDANRNRRRERTEPFDTVTVAVDGQQEVVLWAFVQDTTGPQVRGTEYVDSMTFRVRFNQKIDPRPPDLDVIRLFALPDTIPVAVGAIYTAGAYDSVIALERSVRDSLAAVADSAFADSAATVDTLDVAAPERAIGAVGQGSQDTLPPSPGQVLLRSRPRLSDSWFVRVGAATRPDARFLVDVTARNVFGTVATSRALLIVPAAPPDST